MSFDNGSSATLQGVRFGGYATYGESTGWFLNGVVSGGATAFTGRRKIEFGEIERTAHGRTSGGGFEALLETGYNWSWNRWNFGFAGSAQYSYQGIAGFTETGAESLNLGMGGQTLNSIRTLLGAQLAYSLPVQGNWPLTPFAGLFWQHEFLQYPINLNAALDGGAGSSSSYSTTAPGRDSVLGSVGLAAQVDNRWNFNVFYQPAFGRRDFVHHVISLGAGLQF